jgi:hypothetical protein
MADPPPGDQTLFNSFEYRGFFWLPATPDRRLSGTLRFSEKTIELQLLGTLGDHPATGIAAPPFLPACILGMTEGSKRLTLHNCAQTSTSTNLITGIGASTLNAQHLLIGGHYARDADLQFHSMTLTFANLEQWIAHRAFVSAPVAEERPDGSKSFVAEYIQPPKQTFTVDPIESTISITSDLTHAGIGDLQQEVRTHTARLELEPRTAKHLWCYAERIRQLQNLLTLLMGQATVPLHVTLRGPVDARLPQRSEQIELFFNPGFGNVDKANHPAKMLTLFPYIEATRFATVLTQWFGRQVLLENVCNLFFGVIYNEFLYIQFSFLGLVQALETYCRNTQHGLYVSETDYKVIAEALIAAIPSTTPRDLRESLKRGKIKYGNEYSLRKRLRCLLCSLEDDTVRMITDKPSEFCENVVATRNYYTHYTSELESEAFSDAELVRACLRLRVLLTVVLFKEIGLEEALIREIWTRPDNVSKLARVVQTKYVFG